MVKVGSIPSKIGPILEQEGIVLFDEGMGGWFIARHVKGPGKRYMHRREGFSGCLVITKKRIICYTYWKRQINISVDDPRLSKLYVVLLTSRNCLSLLSLLFFVMDGKVLLIIGSRQTKLSSFKML